MINIRTAVATLTAAAMTLLASCSSPDETATGRSPSATSSTTATSVSSSMAEGTTTEGATYVACRALADDKELAAFWSDINNTGSTSGARGMLAGMAVMQLGRYTSDPAVDPAVVSAMSTAVTEMGNLNQEIAGGVEFDVERFRGIITPVVTACQQAGVDMSVPEQPR